MRKTDMKNLLKLVLMASLLFLAACHSNSTKEETTDSDKGSSVVVRGWVIDGSDQPLPGVKITAPDTVVYTDSLGRYEIPTASDSGRYVLKLEKKGFFYHICSREVTDTAACVIKMLPKSSSPICLVSSFNSSKGAEVSVAGAKVSIPADALVLPDGTPYNGEVGLSVVYLSPDNPRFSELMPGGDLCATRTNGEEGGLISYGMTRVELAGENGEKLQLKSGTKAKLTFPVAASQKAHPHDTIPLWWFDESAGLWREEGVSLNKGDYYEGYVGHFTWWNCDVFFEDGSFVRFLFSDEKGTDININAICLVVSGEDTIFVTSGFSAVPAGREASVRLYEGGGFSYEGEGFGDVCAVIPPLKKNERRSIRIKTEIRKVVALVDEKGNAIDASLHHLCVDYGNRVFGLYLPPLPLLVYNMKDGTASFPLYPRDSFLLYVPDFKIEKRLSKNDLGDKDTFVIVCTKERKVTTSAIGSVATGEEQGEDISATSPEDTTIYTDVDEAPRWLSGNLSNAIVYYCEFPEEALEKNSKGGIVQVRFVVEKDGTISNISVGEYRALPMSEEGKLAIGNVWYRPARKDGKIVRSWGKSNFAVEK